MRETGGKGVDFRVPWASFRIFTIAAGLWRIVRSLENLVCAFVKW